MSKRFDIIGVGDADMDIQLEVDHFPQHDEKVKARIIGRYPGGIIANFLSAAALFGSKCGAVVRVGKDYYGDCALSDLKNRGVDISHAVVYPEDETYFCVTCLDATGEKSMLVCLNNPTQPDPEKVDREYLANAEFVHMIGTYPEVYLPIARDARKYGYRMSIDIEKQNKTMSQEEFRESCSLATIVFPNKGGIDYFTDCGDDYRSGAETMLSWGTQIVVVTLGSEGVYVKSRDEEFSVPAFRVPVVDTTGAGDTFNACFLSSYIKGYSLRDCAYLATAASARQIQQIGSRTGMITREEAIGFLNEKGIALNKQQ